MARPLGVEGVSDFDALHSGKHDDEVQLCAFDILAGGGDDLRKLPLSMRKANLERLLARRLEGVFINWFERGEIGPDLFRAACQIGLEGLVSKRRDRTYHGGRCPHWIKVKNRKHPTMRRNRDEMVDRPQKILCRDARRWRAQSSDLLPRLLGAATLMSFPMMLIAGRTSCAFRTSRTSSSARLAASAA